MHSSTYSRCFSITIFSFCISSNIDPKRFTSIPSFSIFKYIFLIISAETFFFTFKMNSTCINDMYISYFVSINALNVPAPFNVLKLHTLRVFQLINPLMPWYSKLKRCRKTFMRLTKLLWLIGTVSAFNRINKSLITKFRSPNWRLVVVFGLSRQMPV